MKASRAAGMFLTMELIANTVDLASLSGCDSSFDISVVRYPEKMVSYLNELYKIKIQIASINRIVGKTFATKTSEFEQSMFCVRT